MVGVGGKRACTLGMQSLYLGVMSFRCTLANDRSIELICGLWPRL